MKQAFRDVEMFHTICDQPVRTVPQNIDKAEQELRKNLIEEEVFKELFPAMDAGDIVEIADALGDICYVVIGTALHYGIPLTDVWDAIQASNLSKRDPTTGQVIKRADGKVLKGESYFPPKSRIIEVLKLAGWVEESKTA